MTFDAVDDLLYSYISTCIPSDLEYDIYFACAKNTDISTYLLKQKKCIITKESTDLIYSYDTSSVMKFTYNIQIKTQIDLSNVDYYNQINSIALNIVSNDENHDIFNLCGILKKNILNVSYTNEASKNYISCNIILVFSAIITRNIILQDNMIQNVDVRINEAIQGNEIAHIIINE